MPVEKAPSAPCVQVWLSAPMMTSPGTTSPFSGSSDPHVLFVEEVLHVVFFGEVTADACLVCRRNVLGGDEVVQNNGKAVRVRQFRRSGVLERLDGNRCRDVVSDDHVDRYADDFPRMDGFSGMFGKDFFSDSLTHD